MIRFHDRKKVDELIKPILSLDLVEEFYEKDPDLLAEQLPKVQTTFENHMQYMTSWIPLFLYETYNQLISQRSSTSAHDIQLAELLGQRTDKLRLKEISFKA